MSVAGERNAPGGWRFILLLALAAAVAVVTLYLPGVTLELAGDDYQWVQHAHRAMHRPALLLSDLGGFFRPAGTWTLVVDRLLWPWEPAGFHTTNLLLHLVAAALLGGTAWRLGVPAQGSVAVAAVWGVSPWASESALHPSVRFDTLLVGAWCSVVMIWPRHDEDWTGRRRLAAAAALALAAASKETWVVTPGLVLALELAQRRRRGLAALVPAALVTAAVLVYSVAHVALLSLGRTYFAWEPGILATLPQQLAAFFLFAPHQPAGFELTLAGGAAVAVVGTMVWWAWRTRSAAVTLGLVLLLLPALPTLATPVLPLRYATASFAGLVLATGGAIAQVVCRRAPRWRFVGVAAATIVTLAALGWGATRVRLEVDDARRVSDLHARLLRQAARVARSLPEGVPVIIVSRDEPSPLAEIAAAPAGWPKPYFVRGNDPAGLVDSAALLTWSCRDETLDVVHIGDWTGEAARRPGRILFYTLAEGFTWAEEWVPDAGALAAALRERGFGVRLVQVSRFVPQVS